MIHLFLGGTRSGKSALAEARATELAGPGTPVTYVATARVRHDDADHLARIATHRARRPADWTTVECTDPTELAAVLAEARGTVLVDSLGTWLAGHDDPATADVDALAAVLAGRESPTVVVSEEVGLSVHPSTPLARAFVDALGHANQAVAASATTVSLVVAGRAHELPGPAAAPGGPAPGSTGDVDPGRRGAFDGLASAVSFLTVLGPSRQPGPATLAWFPLVGTALGGLLAALWWGADQWWPPAVVAALVVAADLALTGALHADGLADTADGLLPHLAPDRRLVVMTTPGVGAFALAVVPTVLLVRWSAMTGPGVPEAALVVLWGASRTVMAVVPAMVPYARARGLATDLSGGASWRHGLWLAPLALGATALAGIGGLLALFALVATAAGVVALARRRIGGYTGDVLGAAGILAETAGLVVLAAW